MPISVRPTGWSPRPPTRHRVAARHPTRRHPLLGPLVVGCSRSRLMLTQRVRSGSVRFGPVLRPGKKFAEGCIVLVVKHATRVADPEAGEHQAVMGRCVERGRAAAPGRVGRDRRRPEAIPAFMAQKIWPSRPTRRSSGSIGSSSKWSVSTSRSTAPTSADRRRSCSGCRRPRQSVSYLERTRLLPDSHRLQGPRVRREGTEPGPEQAHRIPGRDSD